LRLPGGLFGTRGITEATNDAAAFESNPRGVGLVCASGDLDLRHLSDDVAIASARRPGTALNHFCRIDDGAVAGRKIKFPFRSASNAAAAKLPAANPMARHV
jgi:hypothetical protein